MDPGGQKHAGVKPFKTFVFAKLQAEKEGHEFGTFCFENISEISEISPDFWKPLKDRVEHLEITYEESNLKEVLFATDHKANNTALKE